MLSKEYSEKNHEGDLRPKIVNLRILGYFQKRQLLFEAALAHLCSL